MYTHTGKHSAYIIPDGKLLLCDENHVVIQNNNNKQNICTDGFSFFVGLEECYSSKRIVVVCWCQYYSYNGFKKPILYDLLKKKMSRLSRISKDLHRKPGERIIELALNKGETLKCADWNIYYICTSMLLQEQ